jgi:hypothetical protein
MKRKVTHRTITVLLKFFLKYFFSYFEWEGFQLTWSKYQDLTQYITPAYLCVFILQIFVPVWIRFLTDRT